MMCSNLVDLQVTIDVFRKKKKSNIYHIDVMDGEFVRTSALASTTSADWRELTSIPLDLI